MGLVTVVITIIIIILSLSLHGSQAKLVAPKAISPSLGNNFAGGSAGKESACNVGDLGSIPGLWRFLEEGNGHPLQYSGLKNPMDYTVHGVAKNRTRLNDFHFTLFRKQHKSWVSICMVWALTGRIRWQDSWKRPLKDDAMKILTVKTSSQCRGPYKSPILPTTW